MSWKKSGGIYRTAVSNNLGANNISADNIVTNIIKSGIMEVTGDTKFDGNLNVDGDTELHKKLNVTGNTTLGGTLNVTGRADIIGNLNVDGILNVTNDTDIIGNLDVTGDTHISGTLNVTGDTDISGNLLANSLNVATDTDISGTLNVTGDTDISGNLSTNAFKLQTRQGDAPPFEFFCYIKFKDRLQIQDGDGDFTGEIRLRSRKVVVSAFTECRGKLKVLQDDGDDHADFVGNPILEVDGNTVINGNLTVTGDTITTFHTVAVQTTYDNANPCPQLLFVSSKTEIHYESIKKGVIYHAFWTYTDSGWGEIIFFNTVGGNSVVQKTITNPNHNLCAGGVIFCADGAGFFSIGLMGPTTIP